MVLHRPNIALPWSRNIPTGTPSPDHDTAPNPPHPVTVLLDDQASSSADDTETGNTPPPLGGGQTTIDGRGADRDRGSANRGPNTPSPPGGS